MRTTKHALERCFWAKQRQRWIQYGEGEKKTSRRPKGAQTSSIPIESESIFQVQWRPQRSKERRARKFRSQPSDLVRLFIKVRREP